MREIPCQSVRFTSIPQWGHRLGHRKPADQRFLTRLSHDEKDALIRALWAQVQMLTAQTRTLTARVVDLECRLGEPPKTPGNSSVPPSQGKKATAPTSPNVKARAKAAWGGRAADDCWRRSPTRP
jgi:hypothetical protein